MGHRKVHGPKRGSLAYAPRGRAASVVGRIRYWPKADGKPSLLAFFGIKAGMTHVLAIDNRKGSLTFGKEVVIPATVIDIPPVVVCGIRAYVDSLNGLQSYSEAWMENPPKELGRLITLPEKYSADASLSRRLRRLCRGWLRLGSSSQLSRDSQGSARKLLRLWR